MKIAKMQPTNGEMMELIELSQFLEWMRMESAPVPVNGQEKETLLAAWLRHRRRAAREAFNG